MLPYLIASCLCFCFICVQQKTLRSRAVVIPLAILTLPAALRNYTVGTDSVVYSREFRFPYRHYSFEWNPEIEKGYQWVIMLLKSLHSDYAVYFMTMAVLCIAPVLLVLKKRSPHYFLSVYVFVTFGLYFALYNQVRQAIAMGICFIAIKYLVEKKAVKYALLIALASQFHISALLLLGFYFLCHLRVRLELKVAAIFLIGLSVTSLVIAFMAAGNGRYQHYTLAAASGKNGLMTVLLYVAIALGLYIYGRKLRKRSEEYRVLECSYLCGIAALIPVAMLGTDPAGPQRIAQYFVYYLMLLIPMVLKEINRRWLTLCFCLGAYAYFLLLMANNIGGIYPWKINDAFNLF